MNTIRLMIVDDEPLVRVLIRRSVPWEDMGIEVVSEAGGAEEALLQLDAYAPEIILMDVCMPVMSGIELSAEILRRKPNAKIIVISGHDTFTYAQECLRLGVADYLLKPIHEEQLQESLRKAAESLYPERGNAVTVRSSIQAVIDHLRDHFSDPDLNLQSVADRFFINASYLSRAIKEDTGHSFVETVTALRMEEAKRLLSDPKLASADVRECVGIPDSKYFGVCFKKYTGQTVKEYRRRALVKK